MDLYFGRFADAHLTQLDDAELDAYEELLAQEDTLIMRWVTGQDEVPHAYSAMVERLKTFAISQEI